MLLMVIALNAFHSPFNWHAAKVGPGAASAQAKYVQQVVAEHQKLIDGDEARCNFFYLHAKAARIDKQLYEEDCERVCKQVYQGKDAEPQYESNLDQKPKRTKSEREERRAELEQILMVEQPSRAELNGALKPRVLSLHEAIVTKLTEMLKEQVETGEVNAVVSLSQAACTSFLSEDVFQFARMMHDRYGKTGNGFIDAVRRVNRTTQPWTISHLPWYWPDWLGPEQIRIRARNIIANVWLSQRQVAKVRNAADKKREIDITNRKRKRQDDRSAADEEVMALPGGMVGDGVDAYQLAAGVMLDAEMLRLVDFTVLRGKYSWTVAHISNQLRLRNIPEYRENHPAKWAKIKLAEPPLLVVRAAGGGDELRVTGANRAELAAYLSRVIAVEDRVRVAANRAATRAAQDELARQRVEERELERIAREADPDLGDSRSRAARHHVGATARHAEDDRRHLPQLGGGAAQAPAAAAPPSSGRSTRSRPAPAAGAAAAAHGPRKRSRRQQR